MPLPKQYIDNQYIERTSEAHQIDPDGFREEVNNLFDNPDTRQRVAELIAQSRVSAKKMK